MLSVSFKMVVISNIKGKMLKFIGCWVSIVIKIMISDNVILKLNSMFSKNGGIGNIIMFIIVKRMMGVFKLLVKFCS